MEKIIKKFIKYIDDEYCEYKQGIIEDFLSQRIDILENISNFILENDVDSNKQFVIDKISNKYKENDEKIRAIIKKTDIEDLFKMYNLKRILNTQIEKRNNLSEGYVDFPFVSKVLLKSPLRGREQMEIIFFLIEKNIATGLLSQKVSILDSDSDKKYSSENIDSDKLINMIYDLTLKMCDLTFKQLLSVLIENSRIIKECYFDKINNYDKEDISKIIDALANLGVDKQLNDIIFGILSNKLFKRTNKDSASKEFTSFKVSAKKNDDVLTDKEYKQLNKELSKYYNLHDNVFKRPLTDEEVLYCTELLLKLGKNSKEISHILFRAPRVERKFDNSYYTYNVIYKKLRYYEDDLSIKDLIEDTNNCLLTMNGLNGDDYEFWKDYFINNVDMLKEIIEDMSITKKYEYEIECAKKRIKKR